MDIRRRILLAVLIAGTVAGYSSGIYSAVKHRGDDGDGRACHGRGGHQRWSQQVNE